MKAVVITEFGRPEVLKYINLDMSAVQSKEGLIRVAATGVNFATLKQKLEILIPLYPAPID